MRTHTVADGIRPYSFTGDLLAEVSTHRPGSLRWTELRLYRMVSRAQANALAEARDDAGHAGLLAAKAAGDYLLYTAGPSLVFHRAEDGCRKGSLARLGDLPDGMVACEDCWPPAGRWPGDGDDPDDLDDDAQVRAERDRPRLAVCPQAEDVERALREQPGRKTATPGRLSGPASQLLDDAAAADDGIARWLATPVRLTP
jgi:hypothetical protein